MKPAAMPAAPPIAALPDRAPPSERASERSGEELMLPRYRIRAAEARADSRSGQTGIETSVGGTEEG